MKRFFFLLLIIPLFTACSNDEEQMAVGLNDNTWKVQIADAKYLHLSLEEYQQMSYFDREARRSIFKLGQYVLLDSASHCYKLTISRNEAIKQNIPMKDYDSFINEMAKANQTILEYMQLGKSLQIADPQKAEASEAEFSSNSITRNWSEERKEGIITLGGIGEGEDYVTHGRGEVGSVVFFCRGNSAPFPIFTCKVVHEGKQNMESGMGILWQNTKIKVPVVAFPLSTIEKLYFSCSDSNGSVATWKARPHTLMHIPELDD